jgi:hypothetical protein
MKHALSFFVGLVLALLFAAAAVSAVTATFVTVKDAVQSGGSLETFGARLRHYSDRLEVGANGFRLIGASHPIALHFGMLTLSWLVALGCALGLRHLQRTIQQQGEMIRMPFEASKRKVPPM